VQRQLRKGISIVLCVIFHTAPYTAAAEEPAKWPDWFTVNVRLLTFLDYQDPAASTQNPDNAFLRLYRYSGEVRLRPDFIVDTPIVSWLFKPRVTSFYRKWENGATKGETDSEARFFVNEWMIQPKPTDELFVSFGKEKLLWGSSFLVSPSNILFKDTEKLNPKTEVEGKYMARLVYLPSSAITVDFINRTEKEEDPFGMREAPIRAVKLDVMGGSSLVSVIGYLQQHEPFRLGSFGQWTASDAIVLYYDGLVSKGTDVRYPVQNVASPFGFEFAQPYEKSSRLFTTITAGGSYSFLSGETVSLEFLYNGPGYGDAEAENYYTLRRNAAAGFFDNSPLGGLSKKTLAEALYTNSALLRRYYLMAQFMEREIGNEVDLMLRYVYGLEEQSGLASTILEWQVSDRVQIFNINTVAVGGADTEFNAVLSKSFMAGVEIYF
jgi:hypothetical protein